MPGLQLSVSVRGSRLPHAPSEVELGRENQLWKDLLISLVVQLKHCLFCLFAKHDFTRYPERNSYLEK